MKRSKIQAFVELAIKHVTKEVSDVSNEICFKHKLFNLCYYGSIIHYGVQCS
jgi:hypothetical protein